MSRARPRRSARPVRWLSLLLLAALTAAALGAGFEVLRAEPRLEQGRLLLDADIRFALSEAASEALRNSVPLTLVLRVQILRSDGWLWNDVAVDLEQRFQLKYHALARQYVATNLNTGTLNSFPSREEALRFIGRLRDFPVIAQAQLPGDGYGRIRAELDIESLPAPLRPVAYFSKNWRLGSDWRAWRLP